MDHTLRNSPDKEQEKNDMVNYETGDDKKK